MISKILPLNAMMIATLLVWVNLSTGHLITIPMSPTIIQAIQMNLLQLNIIDENGSVIKINNNTLFDGIIIRRAQTPKSVIPSKQLRQTPTPKRNTKGKNS